MVDVLTSEQRQLNMSRIRGRDTKPEMLIRRGLHALGLRYRLHDKSLPGRPDLVFPRYHAVIFVHGCFWHAHGCGLSKLPATRRDFWKAKLQGNADRDQRVLESLLATGWRVLIIWECALRGPGRLEVSRILALVKSFIHADTPLLLEVDDTNSAMRYLPSAKQPAKLADDKIFRDI